MFIISGYGHYLIWPTTKWLTKDGHKICFIMVAIRDPVRYVQDYTMFQKSIFNFIGSSTRCNDYHIIAFCEFSARY